MKRFLWFGAFILVISSAAAQTGANPKAAPPKSARKEIRCSGARQRQGSTGAARCLGRAAKASRGAAPTVGAGKVPACSNCWRRRSRPTPRPKKCRAAPSRPRATAAQAQQSATEAQRLADQARTALRKPKAALAVVDKKSKEEDKKISALQDVAGTLSLQRRHPGTRREFLSGRRG